MSSYGSGIYGGGGLYAVTLSGETQDTNIYFGRLGHLLPLPHPKGVLDATRARLLDVFEPGAGGARVDQMVGGARTYNIPYEGLTMAAFTRLQAFADGHEGRGPFVLLDPGQRNMLPPNIAGATSVTNGTDGFIFNGITDTFGRNVTADWGTTDSGQAWAVGGSAANHTVANGVGRQSNDTVGGLRSAVLDVGSLDVDYTIDVSLPVANAATAAITQWACARWLDGNNHYIARLDLSPGGSMSLGLHKRVAGALTNLFPQTTVAAIHAANDWWRIRFQVVGASLRAKAWIPASQTEPAEWQVSVVDTDLTTGTSIGLLSRLEGGNTNTLPVVVSWDLLAVLPTALTSDSFNRAVTADWGAATSGPVWGIGGGLVSDFNVVSGVGRMALTNVNDLHHIYLDVGSPNFDMQAQVNVSFLPTGGPVSVRLSGRVSDSNNYYETQLLIDTAGATALTIRRRIDSIGAQVPGSVTASAGTHAAGNTWLLRFSGSGTTLRAKAWKTGTTEPGWLLIATDSLLTTGNSAGCQARRETGSTNGAAGVDWDNVSAAAVDATIASSTAYTDAGPRVLGWTFNNTTLGSLTLDWPSSTFRYGVPMVSGRPLCFSCWVAGGGSDAVVTYTPRIFWRNAVGTLVGSVTSGTPVASAAGVFTQMFATATPPAGAVYADMDIRYTSGASVGSVGHFRRFMLNEGTTPDAAWAAGTGVWPVKVTGLKEAWLGRFSDFRSGPSFTVQEDTS